MNLIQMTNMFNQFIPTKIFFLSITLLGSMLALSWVFFVKKIQWLSKRGNSLNVFLNMITKKLIKEMKIKTRHWKPWLISLFFICLSYNLTSLIPHTFSHTSHLSFTLGLSIPIWMSVKIAGIKSKWKSKISHLLPQGTPLYLTPLMIIIETISLLIQPMTLGFRLGANLLAGHLLIFLCSCTIWEALKKSIMLGTLSMTLILTLFMLEMAVAFMQATVFFMLSKNYLEDNLIT